MQIAIPFDAEVIKKILSNYYGYEEEDINIDNCNVYEVSKIITDLII